MTDVYDILIVGGGPAGLSAAMVLGRCRRRALVCDVGQPRNQASPGSNEPQGFILTTISGHRRCVRCHLRGQALGHPAVEGAGLIGAWNTQSPRGLNTTQHSCVTGGKQ